MICESCNIRQIEVEEFAAEGLKPYRLCRPCKHRLTNRALRPLELFNLISIHGHAFLLHDDFYDYDTGEATQPEIDVLEADKFPFPTFEQIKTNLNRLIDFAFVQYFTDEKVIEQLRHFDKQDVLKIVDSKVCYNRAINYKAFEIVAKVLGPTADSWIKKQWASRKENELQIFAEPLAKCLDFDEAFGLITNELEKGDDKFLSENIFALFYFQSDQTLDFFEKVSSRIKNISSNWGLVAASSQFSWDRANKWLTIGRPLSLVALDSLIYCTTIGDRLNKSLWLQQLQPKLSDNPRPEVITERLLEYLLEDNVPRTKSAIEKIIDNVFQSTI